MLTLWSPKASDLQTYYSRQETRLIMREKSKDLHERLRFFNFIERTDVARAGEFHE